MLLHIRQLYAEKLCMLDYNSSTIFDPDQISPHNREMRYRDAILKKRSLMSA